MRDGRFLLDVNLLIALTDQSHVHHGRVEAWFHHGAGREWSSCALTQIGFLRLKTNPRVGGCRMQEAVEALRLLTAHAGHQFWPMMAGWSTTTVKLQERIFGHRQVTDAYLLGLAVDHDGVFATLDRGILYLAGEVCRDNVLLIE